MLPSAFQSLIYIAGLAVVGGLVADARGSKTLDGVLRAVKEAKAAQTIAFCKANPIYYFLRISVVLGYLASLACVGLFIPGSRESYLAFSVAWSAISYFDGPLILPKPMIPFYDAALLLNGAVLALCFLSPLSSKFQW